MKSICVDQTSFRAAASSFVSVGWNLSGHWDLHSLQVVPVLKWVLGIRAVFLTILLYHRPLEIFNCSLLCGVKWSSCIDSSRIDFWRVLFFLATLVESWLWSLAGRGWYSIVEPNGHYWAFTWFSKSPFVRCCPVRLRGLEHFANGNSTPQTQPTSSYSNQSASVQQTSLL